MIGKVYLSSVDFYDITSGLTRRKIRPVLIVGGPNENDYTALPISTVTNRANLNAYYDIQISAQDRASLSLQRPCYVRTHKQLPIHKAALIQNIGDMKKDTPDLYIDVIAKMEDFQKNIVNYSI